MIYIIVLYALLAFTFTLGKFALAYSEPLFLVAARMLIGGPLLLLAQALRPKTVSVDVSKRDIIDFIQVIFFHIYLSFIPEYWALTYVSSIKVNILYTTTPFVTILLSYLLYNEKLSVSQVMGTTLGFLSLLPLMLRGGGECSGSLVSFSLPDLMLILSISSGAYAWFVIKRLMQRGYSLLVINGWAMLIGGVMSLFTWHYLNPFNQSPIYDFTPFLLSTLALVLVSNVIVYNLYGWLLTRYSLNIVSLAGFLSPLFGALYGKLLLGEDLGWQHLIAMGGITVGLYLFFHDELKQRRELQPPPDPL